MTDYIKLFIDKLILNHIAELASNIGAIDDLANKFDDITDDEYIKIVNDITNEQ